MAGRVLAEETGAAERCCLGQERSRVAKGSGGNRQAGDRSENGPASSDSARRRANHPAGSAVDRRSQCLPSGTARVGPPAAGLLAGKLSRTSRRVRRFRNSKIDTIAVATNQKLRDRSGMSQEQAIAESASSTVQQDRIWDSFRRWGYLQASLDPLGDLEPAPVP